jgi:hypothetical protein
MFAAIVHESCVNLNVIGNGAGAAGPDGPDQHGPGFRVGNPARAQRTGFSAAPARVLAAAPSELETLTRYGRYGAHDAT